MKGERLVARAQKRRPRFPQVITLIFHSTKRTLLGFTVTMFVLKEDTVRQLKKC